MTTTNTAWLSKAQNNADSHDFSSVWIPERHFTRDGWLYPNPAILQAALARETRQIQLRAGSVVLPLHNPLRVAEEWAMVDNLSGAVWVSPSPLAGILMTLRSSPIIMSGATR